MKSPFITFTNLIAAEDKPNYSDLQVLKSAAGFYVGTLYHEADGTRIPGTRDSLNYFSSREKAAAHLQDIIERKARTRMHL